MFKKLRNFLQWKFLTGHINIGRRLTIYGRNAMHWGVDFYTKKYGYICFRLPLLCNGHWYPLYLYFSPNATPWASTFMIGRKKDELEWIRSRIRYKCFGHNFDIDGWNDEYQLKNRDIMAAINDTVYSNPYNYATWFKEHEECEF